MDVQQQLFKEDGRNGEAAPHISSAQACTRLRNGNGAVVVDPTELPCRCRDENAGWAEVEPRTARGITLNPGVICDFRTGLCQFIVTTEFDPFRISVSDTDVGLWAQGGNFG
jgi:hypothetical protein